MKSEFEYISNLMLDVKQQVIIQNKRNNTSKASESGINNPDNYISKTSLEWNRCAGCGIPGPDDHPNPDPPPVL